MSGTWREIGTSVRFAVVAALGCGLLYPAVAVELGGLLFPAQAEGSVVFVEGRAVGSSLVAQPFRADHYLHGRPSPCGHDPRALAGSNLSASSPALRERVGAHAAALAAREGVDRSALPADLVAASGSCVDPEISLAAAALQLPRVARARGLSIARVEGVLSEHRRGGTPWSLGPARVNVLEINLALDRIEPDHVR